MQKKPTVTVVCSKDKKSYSVVPHTCVIQSRVTDPKIHIIVRLFLNISESVPFPI